MSVFTKQAFTMSALPTPTSSAAPSAAPSRRSSFTNISSNSYSSIGSMTPAENPHIAEINVESVLFDMDGTLINSSPAVVRAWELFAEKYPLDLDDILKSAHGMRTIDVLKKWCGISDPEVLATEVLRFESAILEAAEEIGRVSGKSGIEVLPGVAKLLEDLGRESTSKRDGEEKWAICTSSTRFYAGRAIPIAGLPVPKVFVTADDVTNGKPHPDPYLLGAKGCKASPFESLVVEDAPTGIRAGKASGALVLATCTSHSRASLEKERPDFLVEDLSHVQAVWDEATSTFKLIIEQPIDRIPPRPTPDVTPVMTPAGSRQASFSGILGGGTGGWKGSDELTGNDSVFGSPVPSRPGSPGPEEKELEEVIPSTARMERKLSGGGLGMQQGVVTLEAFKRALAGNAMKKREIEMDD